MKKQRIRLTESQLHRVIKESVKRILRETNGTWDSSEDMTDILKKYSPEIHSRIYDTDNTLYDTDVEDEGEWGEGPFMPYKRTSFADGYDYCGDDNYNDAASEYNHELEKELSTKGGQMNYDWKHRYDGTETGDDIQDAYGMQRMNKIHNDGIDGRFGYDSKDIYLHPEKYGLSPDQVDFVLRQKEEDRKRNQY